MYRELLLLLSAFLSQSWLLATS